MKRLLLAIACAMVGPAWADDVLYKCVDGKGAVSITSAPCPAGSKQAWKRDANAPPPGTTPSVTTPAAPPPPRNPPARPAAPAAPPPAPEAPPPPPPVPPPSADPCDHAKDVAAQFRDMPWLELSHDQEQRLLGWVMQQCRQGSSEQN